MNKDVYEDYIDYKYKGFDIHMQLHIENSEDNDFTAYRVKSKEGKVLFDEMLYGYWSVKQAENYIKREINRYLKSILKRKLGE